jgi:hypothetical protein
MTCIVGFVDREKRKIIIGGDSAGVAGLSVRIRKDPKVFVKDNRFIMGFTSSFRMGQILHFMPLPVPEQESNEPDLAFMVKKFIPTVKMVFENNWGRMTANGGESVGGTFLVGYKDNLYCIEEDFQVGLCEDDYDAVGCGGDYALGALYAMNTFDGKYKPEEIVECALKTAVYNSGGVRPPFVIKEIKF